VAEGDLILVTGASGFVAKHCIKAALARGYRVRGTLRRPEAEPAVRAAVGGDDDRLTFVGAHLMSDEGWPEAVAGCRMVLHTASPTQLWPPRDPNKLIVPARDGALRVLKAAADAGVERTVMTSSGAAVMNNYSHGPGHVFTEDDWSEVGDDIGAYPKSKTFAERAAWEFIDRDGSGMTLVVINPTAVFGPVLDRTGGASGAVLIKLVLTGRLPGLPPLAFTMVDVRDVAEAHMRALEVPEAAGERFIAASNTVWLKDIARMLAEAIPSHARKVPRREIPPAIIFGLSRLVPTVRGLVRNHASVRPVSNEKAETVLGLRFRSAEEAAVAMGQSLVEMGLV
jgi:nucleoside-diphosphate-sugar epimerase